MNPWTVERRSLAGILAVLYLTILYGMSQLDPDRPLAVGWMGFQISEFLDQTVVLTVVAVLLSSALSLVVLGLQGRGRHGLLRCLGFGWIILVFLCTLLVDQGLGRSEERFVRLVVQFLTYPSLMIGFVALFLWVPQGDLAKRLLIALVLGASLASLALLGALTLTGLIGFQG